MSVINETDTPLLLRIKAVAALTGLSSPSIHHRYRQGSFPCPVRLGPRTIAWRRSDIELWAAEQPAVDLKVRRQPVGKHRR